MSDRGQIILLGVGTHGFTAIQKSLLSNCQAVVASKRHMELVDDGDVTRIPVTPLAEAFQEIREKGLAGPVAVIASGDPLFFGIGRRLFAEFGSENVAVYPALSTMQEACARFKISWDDVGFLSLHGRNTFHVAGALLHRPKVVVYTDQRNSPDRLARKTIEYLEHIGDLDLLQQCRVYVAENIGMDSERLVSGSLQDIAGQEFSPLNVFIIARPQISAEKESLFGLAEGDISHSRGLITKDEVRAVTLHRLSLPPKGIMWDVGAGSGSISIEAARMNPFLTVYAVEAKEEQFINVKENIRRFARYNIVPVFGAAPEALVGLPTPDAVFVGGSGGNLAGIIEEAARRLKEGGRLVANGVLASTVEQAPRFMAEQGLCVQTSRIEVERALYGAEADSVKKFNAITVMVGEKLGS